MTSVMQNEMSEQPAVIRRLINRWDSDILAISSVVASKLKAAPLGVLIIARGSSLNTGTYMAYLIEVMAGLPVSLARPSVLTRYGAKPKYSGWLAIAISQSGRTPEIVQTAEIVQACGATLITITNDEQSPLAELGSLHLGLGAGPEVAVPATKTVTAQMVTALTIATALQGPSPSSYLSQSLDAELRRLPDAIDVLLADTQPTATLANRWKDCGRLSVLGRGFGFAAANEIALKVREVAAVFGEAWSVTAFRHGPIAGLLPEVPVLITSMNKRHDADTDYVIDALAARGNQIALCAPGDAGAHVAVPLPAGFSEALMPILAVVRGQQLCADMAKVRNLNVDQPRGLSKVTLT
jgi:glutamine---fructose-6-phosphate transaminase (isomerizing)